MPPNGSASKLLKRLPEGEHHRQPAWLISLQPVWTQVVDMLIHARADPRAVDVDGNTPLHFAFAYANVEVGAVLSEEGADVEACNRSGKTPQDVAGLCSDLAPASESGGNVV